MVSFIGRVMEGKSGTSTTHRVTIPKNVVKLMDLKAGDLIEIEVRSKVKDTEAP